MLNLKENALIIVTPIYEDNQASSRLFNELSTSNNNFFIVAIDDGSNKNPVTIDNLKLENINGILLRLKRNVGHQSAISIGLRYIFPHLSPHHVIVTMDSDGEDLPSSISTMLKYLESKDVDIVVAQRKKRQETFTFRLFYNSYKVLFKLLTGRTINFGNFMAIKYFALKRLVVMQELSIHLAGAVLSSKLRVYSCPQDRGKRYAGTSKMNFIGLLQHGFRALIIFSEDVLVRVGIVCAAVSALSILASFIVVALKFVGYGLPGWASIFVGLLVLIFMQTGALILIMLLLNGIIKNQLLDMSNTGLDLIEAVETNSATKKYS